MFRRALVALVAAIVATAIGRALQLAKVSSTNSAPLVESGGPAESVSRDDMLLERGWNCWREIVGSEGSVHEALAELAED